MTRTAILLLALAAYGSHPPLTPAVAAPRGYSQAGAQLPAGVPRDFASPRPEPTGTAAIAGRVLAADTGAPLRRVEISATNLQGPPQTAITDDEGRFVFDALPAGTWRVTASKAGYITQQYGQRRPFGAAAPLVLANGQRGNADFALTRASAINGRVYDEYGEPLAGVQVNVMRSRIAQRSRRLEPLGEGDLTDDTGSFRLHDLPPGEYYVSASLRVAPIDSVIQTTYAPTYYPGTGGFSSAQRITLTPGAEATVDFPLLPFRTARVAGTVLTSSGAPGDAFLTLTSDAGELGVPLGVGGVTRADGTFTLPDVPPGTYTLNATVRSDNSPMAETAAIPLSVYGDDVAGLTLVTGRPATIRGTVVADAGVTRRIPETIDVSVHSTRNGGDAAYNGSERNVFELIAPSGPVRFNIEPPDGWQVKALDANGIDALDAPIDLHGEQNVPVRVVLTDRVTEVSGVLPPRTDFGTPPAVVIFADDSAKWAPPSRHVRTARADQNGRFRITGLPPGERYAAVAIDDLEEGEGDDPEFLARIKDLATTFSLGDAEKRTLDLTVIQR